MVVDFLILEAESSGWGGRLPGKAQEMERRGASDPVQGEASMKMRWRA